jgi:hypothetical protein
MDHRLPLHHCQSVYCSSFAGYWHGRIVCVEDTSNSIVGWCNVCEKYVCNNCALPMECAEKEWNDLFGQEDEYPRFQSCGLIPLILHCKRCGAVLQKGKIEKIFILDKSNL